MRQDARIQESFLCSIRGNFAVNLALLAAPVFGVLSLALTYSAAHLEHSNLQNTLDAAVLAATELGESASPQVRVATAREFVETFGVTYGEANSFRHGAWSGTIDFSSDGVFVEAKASLQVPNMLGAIIGPEFVEVNAASRAVKRDSPPLCLLALHPDAAGSIQIYGNAALKAENCAVMANSKDKAGISLWGANSFAQAAMFGVSGAYSGDNFKPLPNIDIAAVSDPFLKLPVPEAGACAHVTSKLAKDSFELEPGTYCGGLTIKPHATVVLQPGIHVFKDGPLNIGAHSTLTGENVVIAFVGSNAVLNSDSGAQISLTSPDSGTYKNVQFISDRSYDGKWKGEEWTTVSSSSIAFDGMMYLPEHNIWLKGDSKFRSSSPGMTMVVDQLWLQDASSLTVTKENRRNLPGFDTDRAFKYSARLTD
jgi:hypothetical protein